MTGLQGVIRKCIRAIAVLVLGSVPVAGYVALVYGEAGEPKPVPRLSARVEKLMRWLPQDTDAVIVSQEPFEVVLDDSVEHTFRRLPLNAYLALGLNRGDLWNNLQGARIELAVTGCVGFGTRPESQDNNGNLCNIVEFKPEWGDSVGDAFRQCLKAADREHDVGGKKVGEFKIRSRIPSVKNEWTLFLANPYPEILICATNRAHLKRVLRRASDHGTGRALPDSLPEWRQLNAQASVWGLRHYPEEFPEPKHAGSSGKAQATGFVFWLDSSPAAENMITFRYLSGAPDSLPAVSNDWINDSNGRNPQIRQVAPDVIEVALAGEKRDGWHAFFKSLLGYYGFAAQPM